jgi:hypothetical protein
MARRDRSQFLAAWRSSRWDISPFSQLHIKDLFSVSLSVNLYRKSRSSKRKSPAQQKPNLTAPIITTHILTTPILTSHILTMATLNIATDEIAITTKKLQDVEISESELPQTPPAEDLHTTITSVLLPQLSEKASINLPSEELFKKHTSRWSDTTFTAPTAVVNVTSETDITAVVRLPLHLSTTMSKLTHPSRLSSSAPTISISSPRVAAMACRLPSRNSMASPTYSSISVQ